MKLTEEQKIKKRIAWRKWMANNRNKWNKKSRDYHREHPEMTRFYLLRRRSLELGMPFTITREEFKNWYLAQDEVCEYCDLVDLSIEGKLSKGRTLLTFTIDRRNSDMPYSIENMCFCCWTCNRIKSDVFTGEEWREIAQKYIKPKWLKKLERLKSKLDCQ